MLLEILQTIPDKRRSQGKQYDLAHLILFSILAIASGADSYRKIDIFITEHFKKLKKYFHVKWKHSPAYTNIRIVLSTIDSKELEKAFRTYSRKIAKLDQRKTNTIGLFGKTLRGSFDSTSDTKSFQILTAFLEKERIILAHKEIEDCKTNEIPMAQTLIGELGLTNCLFTADALHCQKKR
jgi:predicted nucleotidyltransferase